MWPRHTKSAFAIEEKNPLKQGLKHAYDHTLHGLPKIEEKNPLKQGLKHTNQFSFAGLFDY